MIAYKYIIMPSFDIANLAQAGIEMMSVILIYMKGRNRRPNQCCFTLPDSEIMRGHFSQVQ